MSPPEQRAVVIQLSGITSLTLYCCECVKRSPPWCALHSSSSSLVFITPLIVFLLVSFMVSITGNYLVQCILYFYRRGKTPAKTPTRTPGRSRTRSQNTNDELVPVEVLTALTVSQCSDSLCRSGVLPDQASGRREMYYNDGRFYYSSFSDWCKYCVSQYVTLCYWVRCLQTRQGVKHTKVCLPFSRWLAWLLCIL